VEISNGAAKPSLILLDLNMPKKGGRETLQQIKSDVQLCRIPVLVLTTSSSSEDIYYSYRAGANSFLRKPADYRGLVNMAKLIRLYWFTISKIPVG
jgi:CheY-like chemotaxis protein